MCVQRVLVVIICFFLWGGYISDVNLLKNAAISFFFFFVSIFFSLTDDGDNECRAGILCYVSS